MNKMSLQKSIQNFGIKPSHQCCQKCIRKEMNIKFLMFSFFLFLYHRKKFTIDRD